MPGIGTIISIIISVITGLLKKAKGDPVRDAYKEADKAEEKQAVLEEEISARNFQDEYERIKNQPPETRWKGGKEW